MATNERYRDGDHLSLPVPSGMVSGSSVKVGSIMGVTQTDRASATNFGGGNPVGFATVWTEGVFDLTVVGAIANVGDPVYIVTADNSLTATASGNTLFGYALATQAGTGVVPVKITQV